MTFSCVRRPPLWALRSGWVQDGVRGSGSRVLGSISSDAPQPSSRTAASSRHARLRARLALLGAAASIELAPSQVIPDGSARYTLGAAWDAALSSGRAPPLPQGDRS